MTDVYVVGVGMTPFGKFLDKSVKDLTREAVNAALRDAGVDKSALDCAFFANASQAAIEGQFMIPGEVALRSMGLGEIPVTNVENTRRGESFSAVHGRKTTCPEGHPYDMVDSLGRRRCRLCANEKASARKRHRRREARAQREAV